MMLPFLFLLFICGLMPGSAQNLAFRWGGYYGAQISSMKHVSDAQGNVIVAGSTTSSALVTTPGSFQPSLKGVRNLFVAKYSGSGRLLWATYYGGSRRDDFKDLTSDASGNIYVSGSTESEDFPTTGFRGVGGFVISLDGNGQRRWAVAGNGMKDVVSLAADGSDNLAACGTTGGGLTIPDARLGLQPVHG
jgi:hypothetical protein